MVKAGELVIFEQTPQLLCFNPHVPMVFFRVSYGFSHGFHGQILPFSTTYSTSTDISCAQGGTTATSAGPWR